MNPDALFDMFNRALLAFITDVKPLLGDTQEYQVTESSSKLLSRLDPRRNQQLFRQYVAAPYGDRILARDETFFLQTSEYVGAPDRGIVQLIKEMWSSLHQSDRDAVWAHMRMLVTLSSRCDGVVAAAVAARA